MLSVGQLAAPPTARTSWQHNYSRQQAVPEIAGSFAFPCPALPPARCPLPKLARRCACRCV